MPERIQLSRKKGWTMPRGAIKVDRSTRWGNPFTVDACGSAAAAVDLHRRWLDGEAAAPDGVAAPTSDALRTALAGRNLACWCRLDGPCHADTLLARANGSESREPSSGRSFARR